LQPREFDRHVVRTQIRAQLQRENNTQMSGVGQSATR
jgi:hypothetical protein